MIVAIRIEHRNVRGTIQLPTPLHTTAATLTARTWKRTLGEGWVVSLVDESGRSYAINAVERE